MHVCSMYILNIDEIYGNDSDRISLVNALTCSALADPLQLLNIRHLAVDSLVLHSPYHSQTTSEASTPVALLLLSSYSIYLITS